MTSSKDRTVNVQFFGMTREEIAAEMEGRIPRTGCYHPNEECEFTEEKEVDFSEYAKQLPVLARICREGGKFYISTCIKRKVTGQYTEYDPYAYFNAQTEAAGFPQRTIVAPTVTSPSTETSTSQEMALTVIDITNAIKQMEDIADLRCITDVIWTRQNELLYSPDHLAQLHEVIEAHANESIDQRYRGPTVLVTLPRLEKEQFSAVYDIFRGFKIWRDNILKGWVFRGNTRFSQEEMKIFSRYRFRVQRRTDRMGSTGMGPGGAAPVVQQPQEYGYDE